LRAEFMVRLNGATVGTAPRAMHVGVRSLKTLSDFKNVLARLRLSVPLPRSVFKLEESDRFCNNMIAQLSPLGSGRIMESARQRLNLVIQKYFPDSEAEASIFLVSGGWSGTPLFRLSIEGDNKEYYLKFFSDERMLRNEVKSHEAAKKWLGARTVDIISIPELQGPKARGIIRAFPPYKNKGNLHFPVCYSSAGDEKITLKKFYREANEDQISRAYSKLLEVLSSGQGAYGNESRSPQRDANKRDFFHNLTQLSYAANTMADLESYWHGFLEHSEIIWSKNRLEMLLKGPLPKWLGENKPVCMGHVHGDPNSRNCLVERNKPENLLLIDCGTYESKGYRVFDLSQIETDIKLVLMASEESGYGDLDAQYIRKWAAVEFAAIKHGLEFKEKAASLALALVEQKEGLLPSSIKRAYNLIAMVRKHAHALSTGDDSGAHYFAGLLFGDLHWLDVPMLRRTKKMLALYSAAQILGKYEPD